MDNNQEKEKKNPTEGMVGIRQTLRDMGFSDSAIGYNENTNAVTLDGRTLMTPGYLDEEAGISYAKTADIQKSLVDYYRNTENPLVRVSDAYATAAGNYGLTADALTYGNGTVSVAGKPISILYIDDEGKAWARQNAVTNAVKAYVDESGVQNPQDLAKYYADHYLTGAKSLADRLFRREEFSYDPETDPVFLAYRNKYQLEGERAGRNAVSDMAGLTGGYASSAAVTAGAQARQYYAKQLSDAIPELAQQAFDRYLEKYQADLDLLGKMVDLYDTAYQNAAAADNAQRENVNAVARSNVERDQAAWEKNWTDSLNQQKYEIAGSEHKWDEILNTLEMASRVLSNQEAETHLDFYEDILQAELSGKQLSNQETETHLDYYGDLLREDLAGKQLSNQEKETYLTYYGELLQQEVEAGKLSNQEATKYLEYYERLLNKQLWS